MYLHGIYERQGDSVRFVHFLAKSISDEDERESWSEFWKYIDSLGDSYSVYYYAPYEKTKYLCSKINEVYRRTNLAQYGIGMAVISLCGASVEGFLAGQRKVTSLPSVKNAKTKTLGTYIWGYINNLRCSPKLKVLFLFLLAIRNQVHPKDLHGHNRYILIDMILANFVYRLTEGIIVSMVRSSSKRNYKVWYAKGKE